MSIPPQMSPRLLPGLTLLPGPGPSKHLVMLGHDPLVAAGHQPATEVLVRRTLVLTQARLITITIFKTQRHAALGTLPHSVTT